MWPLRALVKACAYGTFGMVGVVLFVHEDLQGRIRKSECYIEAFRYLHENNGAVKYFGEPLKAGYATTIDESENQSGSIYCYKVPLRGPDGRGSLYYKTVKEQKWYLAKVEVELEKLPGRKFLLMETNKQSEKEPSEEHTKGEFTEGEFAEGEFTEGEFAEGEFTEEV